MLISILIGIATVIIALILIIWLAKAAYHTYHEGVPGVIITFGIIILIVMIIGFAASIILGGA